MSKADRFRSLAQAKDDPETTNPQKPDVIASIVGTPEKNFSTQPISNTSKEKTNVTLNQNTETEKTNSTNNNTTDTSYETDSVNLNTDTEQSNVRQSRRRSSATRIPSAIEEFEKRLKRPTIEETHTRATWLVRNDILKRLEKLSRNQSRGFKTHVVNYAIERILDELEGR